VPAVQLTIQLCPDAFQFESKLTAAYGCRRNGLSGLGRQSVTSQVRSAPYKIWRPPQNNRCAGIGLDFREMARRPLSPQIKWPNLWLPGPGYDTLLLPKAKPSYKNLAVARPNERPHSLDLSNEFVRVRAVVAAIGQFVGAQYRRRWLNDYQFHRPAALRARLELLYVISLKVAHTIAHCELTQTRQTKNASG
jgi:hypothetical protein